MLTSGSLADNVSIQAEHSGRFVTRAEIVDFNGRRLEGGDISRDWRASDVDTCVSSLSYTDFETSSTGFRRRSIAHGSGKYEKGQHWRGISTLHHCAFMV